MNLKDILIMEVPSGALKLAFKDEGLVGKNNTEEMAESIASEKPTRASALATEFQFAGSTAVNVHILMSKIAPELHVKTFFKSYLVEKFGPTIFASGIRPILTEKPQLMRSYDLGEKLVLAFSFLGPQKRYLDNYEVVVRRPQMLDYVVVHFSPFSLEIRSSLAHNELFKRAVLDIMGIEVEVDVAWDKLTKLNDVQSIDLAKSLSAQLKAAKHKMTEGVYATKAVTATTQVDDLAATPEYQAEFKGKPMKKKTLVYKFRYSFGYEEDVSFVITDEGLWFRTKVGEEVISDMLAHILKIKYPSEEPIGELTVEYEEIVSEDVVIEQLTVEYEGIAPGE